jgi:hypothetical protein
MEQVKNESGITGLSLIALICIIFIIFIVIALVIERYLLINQNNKVLIRVIIFAFMLNVAILFFLVMSFSKLKFSPGPPGARGIRGRPGRSGTPSAVNGCKSVPAKLGQLKLNKRREATELILEKPFLA